MNKPNGKTLALALFGLLTMLLSGCQNLNSYVPTFIKPHKVEIQQGNVVTPEQIALLRQGMTRDQVRFLLGTPLLSDVFHTNRWDYIFRLKKQDESVEQNRLTLFFDDNSLQKYATTIPLPPEASANFAPPPVVETKAAEEAAAATPIPAPDVAAAPVAAMEAQAAPATPATQAAAPALDLAVEEAAIRALLENWRAAWAGKDADTYLGLYAASFKPQDMERSAWAAQRRERLGKPKKIDVKIEDMHIAVASADQATVSFRQIYQSDLLREQGRKTLALIKENGQWRIDSEQFTKLKK